MTDASIRTTLADGLQDVVGRALSSVTFVADYVQFDFNGPVLTAYTSPVVSTEPGSLKWGEPGYRDALCFQIGRHIMRVEADQDRVATVFEGNSATKTTVGRKHCSSH